MNALQKQALKKITELVKGMHLEHPMISPDNPSGDERLLGLAQKTMEEKTACQREDEQARQEILAWIKALADSE